MAKEEWGVKRVCPTTGKRFYDLNRTPIISPYTGEVVEIENGRSRLAADQDEAIVVPETAADDDVLVEDDVDVDVDVDVDLDDDVLDDDDDDSVSLDEIADVASDDDDS